ncbi:MAG: PEGA domain-containing protein [Deltaproteobacteria bacterium]|nr:MAG: PEGA domain-containing protein [Deltaproteobacteria bacterium]
MGAAPSDETNDTGLLEKEAPLRRILRLGGGLLLAGGTFLAFHWVAESSDPGRSLEPGAFITPLGGTLARAAGVVTPGLVYVETRPAGAKVFAGETLLGTTPLLTRWNPPGKEVTLRIERKGYEPVVRRIEDAHAGIHVDVSLMPAAKPLRPSAAAPR